ncbi:hypothetical protein SIM91_18390 [Rhodococcus opacus]|uniref:ATP dependent DNA ligase n=1 Tax=Rhodococcus opacus TaxID=37919 RepID=UPI0027DDF92F|nr:hypothetical protein [Rhodococcus opacus]MDX5965239.1 hypothetical protein [Rhodococcus opacus]
MTTRAARGDRTTHDSPRFTATCAGHTKGARWVEPRLVGDVEYREHTSGGLRHPSWKGLRDDKAASEVDLPGRH